MRAFHCRVAIVASCPVAAVTVLLLTLLPMPVRDAVAADRVIARDTHIQRVLALDGLVLYHRFIYDRPDLKRPWMRIVNGRVLPARRLAPRHAGETVLPTDIGLDANGRVVVPFASSRFDAQGELVSQRWFVYDVAADRARPLRPLPPTLDDCSEVTFWRGRMAYSTCDHAYLRIGDKRRRVPVPSGLVWSQEFSRGSLTLRGATLFGDLGDNSDGIFPTLLADASGFCRRTVPGLEVGAEGNAAGFWLSRRYLTWATASALVGARLRGRCRIPAPAGLFFTIPSGDRVMAVDDSFVYYGDTQYSGAATIRRHRLPRRPVTASPANDDFQDATPLNGNAPLTAAVMIGTATTQPGEPPLIPGAQTRIRRAVWYAFRPTRADPYGHRLRFAEPDLGGPPSPVHR